VKALEEVLDAVIFRLPEEVFKIPGCSIKEPFAHWSAETVPGTAKLALFSQFLLDCDETTVRWVYKGGRRRSPPADT
jgi:hypothetical protein